jgi:methylmalonyl-CoA/ethylmalonyl-CoA epimerase
MSEDRDQIVDIKPIHWGVSVPDIEASIKWYGDILGFKLESNVFLPQAHSKVAFMCRGDYRIELFEVEGAEGLPAGRRVPNEDLKTHGNKHQAFSIRDIHKFVDYLKARNVVIAKDIFQVGDDLVVFINDNTGNLIEFIQKPE